MQSTYAVSGMTCGHCVMHITNEVKALPGVEDVVVTLDDGRMVVTSAGPVDFDALSEAVTEAGDYSLTPA